MPGSISPSRWYLIHCKPREDARALEHLQRQGFECYWPTIEAERIRRRHMTVVEEALFPRYLFMHLNEVADNWYPIRSTRGVSRIVCCNGQPVPVPDQVIEGIRARLPGCSGRRSYLKFGERVEITDGPFASLEAIFVAREGDERVVLLMSILQQDHRLTFPIQSVRRIQESELG